MNVYYIVYSVRDRGALCKPGPFEMTAQAGDQELALDMVAQAARDAGFEPVTPVSIELVQEVHVHFIDRDEDVAEFLRVRAGL